MGQVPEGGAPNDETGRARSSGRRWHVRLTRASIGIGLIAISVVALAAPLATGTWSLQFLGLLPFAVGLTDLYSTIANPALRSRPAAYASGLLALAVTFLLYVSPGLVVTGIVVLLIGVLVLDGVVKLGQALSRGAPGRSRTVLAVNGASSLALAAAGWLLWKAVSVDAAIGVAIAGYTAMAGWRLLASPTVPTAAETDRGLDVHPDPGLALGPQALFAQTRARLARSAPATRRADVYWLATIGLVLFFTHVARMRTTDTWLGIASPFVATFGDIIMAVGLGALVILPLRLLWRRVSRPLERKAWRLRIAGEDRQMAPLPRRLLRAWTDARFAFSAMLREARASLPATFGLAIRLGLPLAILFAAVNPIWGFSWYFNTESWASAFYQKVTELRVDIWRERMIDAVERAYPGDRDGLFAVHPPGIDEGDFSFIVIGDTGEGDPSQYSLVDRYLDLGRRDDVKFLVISSDVIYPAGAMVDYEANFYMPFKGFTKPIYAIPGNHDWFDALEGFNANFLEPKAARLSLSARADADMNLTSTDRSRIDRLLDRAERLRTLYRIDNDHQRGAFFEIQTPDFAIVAVDTGIRRTIDPRQRAWLEAALARSRGKFLMAIVGHPRYAAGVDTSLGDADFAALYAMLEDAGARVLMAGDTHTFEYYAEETAPGEDPIHHFVNGGGGAYLSIGGALAWPDDPPARTWGFYPSRAAIRLKLDEETPAWKQPFWQWIKRFGAWPIQIETLSGMFDFNNAPFFQSFMEVRVERSRNRVVFALHGVDGPVPRVDLQISPEGWASGDPGAPVEFVVPLSAPDG